MDLTTPIATNAATLTTPADPQTPLGAAPGVKCGDGDASAHWAITDQELEMLSVPLGRLSSAEVHRLRRDTRGETSIMRVLAALRKIAPRSLASDEWESLDLPELNEPAEMNL